MAHGTVEWFDPSRGFGFISRAGFVSRDAGGADVYVHHSQIACPSRVLEAGELVTFTLDSHHLGLRATDVHAA